MEQPLWEGGRGDRWRMNHARMPQSGTEILLGRSYRSTEGQGIFSYFPRCNFNDRSKILIQVRRKREDMRILMNREKWSQLICKVKAMNYHREYNRQSPCIGHWFYPCMSKFFLFKFPNFFFFFALCIAKYLWNSQTKIICFQTREEEWKKSAYFRFHLVFLPILTNFFLVQRTLIIYMCLLEKNVYWNVGICFLTSASSSVPDFMYSKQ